MSNASQREFHHHGHRNRSAAPCGSQCSGDRIDDDFVTPNIASGSRNNQAHGDVSDDYAREGSKPCGKLASVTKRAAIFPARPNWLYCGSKFYSAIPIHSTTCCPVYTSAGTRAPKCSAWSPHITLPKDEKLAGYASLKCQRGTIKFLRQVIICIRSPSKLTAAVYHRNAFLVRAADAFACIRMHIMTCRRTGYIRAGTSGDAYPQLFVLGCYVRRAKQSILGPLLPLRCKRGNRWSK